MSVVTQQTLFDCADEPTPVTIKFPVEPWLVERLVLLGVSRAEAEGYSLRQAYAAKGRLERALADKERGKPSRVTPIPATADEPHTLPAGGVGFAVRQLVAEDLAALVSEFEAGRATEDELFRYLRGSLYVFGAAELVRVAKGLVPLMRGT